jgi:hypothetical protein
LDPGLDDAGFESGDFGLLGEDVFLASGQTLVERGAGRFAVFEGDAKGGIGAVEFESGNGLRSEQLVGAVEVDAGVGEGGIGRAQLGFEAELFLGARAGLQCLQIGAGAGQLSLQRVEARLEFIRAEPRHEITLRYALSFADRQINEEAGDLESEFDLLGRIDAAGKGAAPGVFAAGDDERADGAHEFGRWFRWPRAGGEEERSDDGAAEENVSDHQSRDLRSEATTLADAPLSSRA